MNILPLNSESPYEREYTQDRGFAVVIALFFISFTLLLTQVLDFKMKG